MLDDGDFLEVHAGSAPNMVCGFGRVTGSPVGVVANQPMHFAGCLDINAAECVPRISSAALASRVLAARIREMLVGEPALSERKMFGGPAFLVGGNMALAASGHGGLMVRVDPTQSGTLVSATPARIVEMRGRQMRGWLYLEAAEIGTADELMTWVRRAVTFTRSLPAKR